MTDLDDIHEMIVGREKELHAEVLQEYSHCQGRPSDLVNENSYRESYKSSLA